MSIKKSPFYSTEFYNEILPSFLSTIKSEKTKLSYASGIRIICDYLEKDFLLIDAKSATDFFSHLYKLYQQNKISRKTINARLSCYCSLGRFIENCYPTLNYNCPFYNIERFPVDYNVSINNIPSLSEMDCILSAAKEEPMWYLIIALAGRAALSPSSILKIRKNTVRVDGECVYLYFESDNPTQEASVIVLPSDVGHLMKDYIQQVSTDTAGHIFFNRYGNPLTLKNISNNVKRFVQASNITNLYSIKDFRSRALIDMTKAGVSDSQLAEYSGLSTNHMRYFSKAAEVVSKSCPANLVNYQLKV